MKRFNIYLWMGLLSILQSCKEPQIQDNRGQRSAASPAPESEQAEAEQESEVPADDLYGKFLNISKFDDFDTDSLTRDQVIEQLENDDFFSNFYKRDSKDDKSAKDFYKDVEMSDECRELLTLSGWELKGQQDKVHVVYNKSKNCEFTTDQGGEDVTWDTDAAFNVFMFMKCEGKDFSNNKSLDELEDLNMSVCSYTEYFLNIKSNYDFKYDKNGAKGSRGHIIHQLVTTQDGKSCVYQKSNGKMALMGNCYDYEHHESYEHPAGKDERREKIAKKLVFKNTKASIGDSETKYFKEGTVDIEVNDWSGTLTYESTGTKPLLKLSKGNLKIEGTLDTLELGPKEE